MMGTLVGDASRIDRLIVALTLTVDRFREQHPGVTIYEVANALGDVHRALIRAAREGSSEDPYGEDA